MNSHPTIAFAILSALLIAVGASPCLAAGSSATVHVTATVRPWMKFSATQPVSHYQVAPADLQRGYVDLPRAITLQVQTNIPEEIRFELANAGPERVLVRRGGTAPADHFHIAPAHPAVPITQVLDLRVILPAGAQTGTYPLQVALAPVAY